MSSSENFHLNSRSVNDDDSICDIDKYEDTDADKQRRRMKLLGSQALLFVMLYIMCNIWAGIMLLQESTAQTQKEKHAMMVKYFSIAILQAIFYPLQGFCNKLVYVRPKYLTFRYGMPDETRFSVARQAVFGEDVDNNNNHNEPPSPSLHTRRIVGTPSMVNT
jgi:hypothetical protein